MIKATVERLEKLKQEVEEQAERLPEKNFFNEENDIVGMHFLAKMVQWTIDNFDDKEAIQFKVKELEERQDKSKQTKVIDRLDSQLAMLDFVTGEDDTFYRDYTDEEEVESV